MSSISPPQPRWTVVALVAFHATFLFSMANWLWSREHYQFFPLVLMGSALLAWLRLNKASWTHTPILTPRIMWLGSLSLVLFAVAVLWQSNWIGCLAAISSIWTAIRFYGGPSLARRLKGPVMFLFLAIPLPLNLDLALVISLQKLATRLASLLLDYDSIWHTVSGVAIRTFDRNFMVEEACSGVHSLFSCLTATAFFCVFQRYGLFRSAIVLVLALGWVVLANVFRVFIIVYAFSKWGVALDVGWKHDAVGVSTYLVALICSLSAAQLLEFFVPVFWGPTEERPGGAGESSSVYFAEPQGGFRTVVRRFLDRPLLRESTSARIVSITLLAFFAPLSAFSLGNTLTSWRSGSAGPGENFDSSVPDLLSNDALPNRVGQWNQENFERVTRDPTDPLGTNSAIWTYQGNGMTAQFSVDGFYPEWHDLSYCYTATDWNLNEAKNLLMNGIHATLLDLYRDSGEHGRSWFGCYDSTHQSVQPKDPSGTTWRTLLNRIRKSEQSGQTVFPPVYQCQLMVITSDELLPHESKQASDLFIELSQIAVKTMAGGSK